MEGGGDGGGNEGCRGREEGERERGAATNGKEGGVSYVAFGAFPRNAPYNGLIDLF